MLLACSRQVGKSKVAAALGLRTALLAPTLTLIISKAERQSMELLNDKLMPMYRDLGSPIPLTKRCESMITFQNGSRIIALPGKEETIRSFSGVNLLIMDEAARIPDALNYSVGAFLAKNKGRKISMTSPFGQRGWFWDAWRSAEPYDRYEVPAEKSQCSWLTPEFLTREKKAIGARWYAQEYECSFIAMAGSVFDPADVDAMLGDTGGAANFDEPVIVPSLLEVA